MRAGFIPVTLTWQQIAYDDDKRRIFMCRNLSAANTMYLQFGPQPSQGVVDSWPVKAGEVFTLDPAACKEAIWVVADAANISNAFLIG